VGAARRDAGRNSWISGVSALGAKRPISSGECLDVAVHAAEPGTHRVDRYVRGPSRPPAPYVVNEPVRAALATADHAFHADPGSL
jgi:hypothetical protein